MNLRTKRLSIISMILVLSLSIVGCTRSAERDVYKAFQKSMDIRSAEASTEVSFTLEGTGLDETTQMMLDQVKPMLGNSKFHIKQKQILNSEGTVGKAEVELGADMNGMKMDMSAWLDLDYTGKNPKQIMIGKVPPMVMETIGLGNTDKEYIVYDVFDMLNSLNEEQEIDMDFSKLMNLTKDFQPEMEKFMKMYFEDFKSDKKLVTYMGKEDVDGKDVSMYSIKLDDESLKSLVKSAGNYSLDNKENIEFLKYYMDFVLSVAEMMDIEGQISEEDKAEINKELSSLESKLPEFKKTFNEFMDKTKDVKIIGDKGIVIDLGIDKDGYIVSEKGSIDLSIDLSAIAKVVSADMSVPVEQAELPTGVISFGINYNTKIKNINKDLKISLPKTDEKNSISVTQLMEAQRKQFKKMMESEETIETEEVN